MPAATGQPGREELLASYLAANDAACPACRYNLRGVTSATCPECGLALNLGIRDAGGMGRRWGLMLLVFCWLLLAGGVNDYRAIQSIYRTATSRQVIALMPNVTWTMPSPAPGDGPGNEVLRQLMIERSAAAPSDAPPADEAGPPKLAEADAAAEIAAIEQERGEPGTLTVSVRAEEAEAAGSTTGDEPPAPPASPAPSASMTRRGFAFTPDITVSPSLQMAYAGLTPTTAPRWSAVTWTQWTKAAWWTVLSLAALFGLGLLVWHRRRPASKTVMRSLTGIAWCAFTGYFAYHLVSFVRELI